MRADIVPGATLRDYELPDHTDTLRKLSYIQGDDPLVLMIGRGNHCPKDRNQWRQMREFAPQAAVGYVQLVTILVDDIGVVNDIRLSVGANWPFLRDEDRIIQKDLDIYEYTSGEERNTMIPYTFVLEPGLKIYKIYNGFWYWGRPTTAELHVDLREVSRRCRFDYDLGKPEVKAAWERGEKDKFFPYGKEMPLVHARTDYQLDQYE